MIPFADASSMPPPEALSATVNVFFYIMGGLGGLAICLNQGKQFFGSRGKREDQFATVGQLEALEVRLSGPLQRIYHMDKILALLAEKASIDPRKYET